MLAEVSLLTKEQELLTLNQKGDILSVGTLIVHKWCLIHNKSYACHHFKLYWIVNKQGNSALNSIPR